MTSPSPDPSEPSSSSPPPTPSRSPFFLPPSQTNQPDPSPLSPEETPLSSADPVDSGDLEPVADSPSDTPSRGRGRAKLKALRATMRKAVETAGGVAHQLLARTSPEQHHGVWLPDDDDVADIAEPLASLASRRAPAAIDNPDAADLMALGAALLAYVVKNLTLRSQLGPADLEGTVEDHAADADASADPGRGVDPGPAAPAPASAETQPAGGLAARLRLAGRSGVDPTAAVDYAAAVGRTQAWLDSPDSE